MIQPPLLRKVEFPECFYRSTSRKHLLGALLVSCVNQSTLPQIAQPLGTFAREKVTVVRFVTFDPAIAR
jgi:hypothetical protein